MATLALKGILAGVDKIPDTWFDKIPYYQSEEARREERERKKAKKSGQRSEPSRHRGKSEHRDGDHRDHREARRRRSHEDRGADERDGGRRREDPDEFYPATRRSSMVNHGTSHSRRGDEEQYDHSSRSAPRAGATEANRGSDYGTYPYDNGPSTAAAYPGGRRYSSQVNDEYDYEARANTGVYAEDDRPRSSGPSKGYVPYASIYTSPSQSIRSPEGRSPRTYTTGLNDRRGSQAPSHTSHSRRSSLAQGRTYHSDDDHSEESDSHGDIPARSRSSHHRSHRPLHGRQTERLHEHDERGGPAERGLE